MKCSVFWDMTQCSPLKVNRRFGRTCRLHIQYRRSKARNQRESRWKAGFFLHLSFNPEDRSDMFHHNISWLSTGYTASCPRRQKPPLWNFKCYISWPCFCLVLGIRMCGCKYLHVQLCPLQNLKLSRLLNAIKSSREISCILYGSQGLGHLIMDGSVLSSERALQDDYDCNRRTPGLKHGHEPKEGARRQDRLTVSCKVIWT
jgi:hypothetical protein